MSWRVLAACAAAGALLCACGSTVSAATAVKNWASTNSFGQGAQDMITDSSNVHAEIVKHRVPGADLTKDFRFRGR